MFTGIVEGTGRVVSITPAQDAIVLTFEAPFVLTDVRHGDSIAVEGVCLTVTTFDEERFSVDVMQESLERSVLGALVPGDRVNLERAMRADARFGGHIVQGHVDGTSRVRSVEPSEHWTRVTVDLPPALAPYVVEKGSITVNGVSLTVASRAAESFSVSLIPTTLEVTTLGEIAAGDPVNLEVDVLAKYVEQIMGPRLTALEARIDEAFGGDTRA